MNKMQKLCKYMVDKEYRFWIDSVRGKYNNLTDEEFLKRKFKIVFNRELDLENPLTYSEKLQWLKLYNRVPEYTIMVDKYAVKKYVSDIIGAEHVIPAFGVWDSFDEIDFDDLPKQFVLKCTHDSGGLFICKNKEQIDKKKLKHTFDGILSRNYYYLSREWPYKNVPPKIIAEEYMEDEITKELRDYKFFAFNGKAKIMFIATERQSIKGETKFDFFDMDFNHLPFENGHPNAHVCPSKPNHFEEMIKFTELLSKDIPHVRVDFYEANDKVYFGEMTFFHWGGFMPFNPESWDEKLGAMIVLPPKSC